MNTNSDPHFNFPSFSSSPNPIPFHPHKKQRKKRTKVIKIEPSLVGCSSDIKPKKYGKKPDPSAPKITRPCTECGKKFWSWKALFGHMRCHPERQWRGINPPPDYRRPISPIQDESLLSAEDHEVASCLLFLSNSTTPPNAEEDGFECSSCKKVFGSHQALGGHRASHKNVKGCFAITKSSSSTEVVEDEIVISGSGGGDNGMVMSLEGHKCSICLRVFSSGQALGGHMRCHWDHSSSSFNSNIQQGLNGNFSKEKCGLDLNLPAPLEDGSSSPYYSPGFTLDLRLGV